MREGRKKGGRKKERKEADQKEERRGAGRIGKTENKCRLQKTYILKFFFKT